MIETTSKVSLKLPRRINLERGGAHAELSTLDTAHKLRAWLEAPGEQLSGMGPQATQALQIEGDVFKCGLTHCVSGKE